MGRPKGSRNRQPGVVNRTPMPAKPIAVTEEEETAYLEMKALYEAAKDPYAHLNLSPDMHYVIAESETDQYRNSVQYWEDKGYRRIDVPVSKLLRKTMVVLGIDKSKYNARMRLNTEAHFDQAQELMEDTDVRAYKNEVGARRSQSLESVGTSLPG